MNCNTTHYRANSSSVPGDPTELILPDAEGRGAWHLYLLLILAQFFRFFPEPLRILLLLPLIAFAGWCSVAVSHYWLAALRERLRRHLSAWEFLCPQCLHSGAYDFACDSCDGKVESLPAYTGGRYVSTCPHCDAPLFADRYRQNEAQEKTLQMQAYCQTCEGVSPRHIHHHRRVRVLATLREEDFTQLCQASDLTERRVQGGPLTPQYSDNSFITFGLNVDEEGDHRVRHPLRYACLDDSACLTYILLCENEGWLDETVPPTHALRHVETVWLDAEEASSLRLGQAIDRFVRHSGHAEAGRRNLTVCVRQTELDAVVKNRLEALLGRISYGVEPTDFLGLKTPAAGTQPALADSSASPETVAAEFTSAHRQKEFQER